MASVFLSYDREDADRARSIAMAIEKAGHSVWWDRHIKGGAQYSKEIEQALAAAEAVVVLWSQRSVDSAWVRDEAAAGRDSGRLVPASLDGTDPPLGFRQFQTIDLSRQSVRHPNLDELIEAVEALAGAPPESAQEVRKRSKRFAPPIYRSRLAIPLLIAAILLAGAFAIWRLASRPSSTPVVLVAAADTSVATQALARNLMVKLGSLPLARTDAIRLVGPDSRVADSSDLIFEASGANDPKLLQANLALLAGNDRAVLWSKAFRRESSSEADLEQRMAYTAAQVLGCALEATSQRGERLSQQALKLFLNGCALFGEQYRTDPRAVAPIFLEVVAKAPRFQPAWGKLLLAEAQITRTEILYFDRQTPGALPEHIRTVRKLNPGLPELYVAESALLPINAFAERSRLIDEAVQLNPENPHLLVIRSEFLSFVGQMGESADDSRRAVDLDPLSPGIRSNLIQNLAYAGRIDAALEELRRAEQLWPGTPTIEEARFRLNSRYGDAADALRVFRAEGLRRPHMTPDLEAFLLARLDPSEPNVKRAIDATRSPGLNETRSMVLLVQLLGEFGRDDELYGVLMRWRQPDRLGIVSGVFFRPPLHKFRHDPRFMRIAAKGGLVDYWRKSGKWPDFCSEPGLPYDCKVEAAKIAP